MAASGDRVSPSAESEPREQRRRSSTSELSRAQILDAAEAVFARKGFHDATVKEIAAAAEFSVGGVYSFFADKDDLFVQIYLRRGAEFMAGMRAVLAEPGIAARRACTVSPTSRCSSSASTPTSGGSSSARSGVTLGDLVSKIDQAVVENYTEAMNLQTKLFRAGQDAGELRDGDPEVLAVLFSGLVVGVPVDRPAVSGPADERMTARRAPRDPRRRLRPLTTHASPAVLRTASDAWCSTWCWRATRGGSSRRSGARRRAARGS